MADVYKWKLQTKHGKCIIHTLEKRNILSSELPCQVDAVSDPKKDICEERTVLGLRSLALPSSELVNQCRQLQMWVVSFLRLGTLFAVG